MLFACVLALFLILRFGLLFVCVWDGDLQFGFVVLLYNLIILGWFVGDWFASAGFVLSV